MHTKTYGTLNSVDLLIWLFHKINYHVLYVVSRGKEIGWSFIQGIPNGLG